MAPKKKCKSKPISQPKLNDSNSKIVKPKHVRPVKRTLYHRRSSRLNPFATFVFGTHSPDLQAMISWKILSNFDPIQQLKLRAVSPMWDYNVRLVCRQVREIVLNFSKADILSNMAYENKIVFNMKEEEITPSTIELITKLYSNIDKLQIIYSLVQDTDKLFEFLRHFTKVTKFKLIIYERITTENFLPQLFTTINDHLAPLTALSLDFYSKDNKTFPKLKFEQFEKTLSFLQGYAMTFEIENMTELFELIGKSLPADRPFKGMCVPARFKSSQIAPMFEHNPKLSQSGIFQLSIQSVDVLDCILTHLPKLEILILERLPELVEGRFTIECIRTIGKLVHLTKLGIENFQPMIINQFSESLLSIRDLFITNASFFENIEAEWHLTRGEHVQPIKVMYKPFIENFAKQFPNLEQLDIETNLSKIDGFKNEFIDLCLKNFSKLKIVNLWQHNK